MNELVFGGFTPEALAYDGLIRDPSQRLSYRRTFWRMFTYGGGGCGEATWLDLKAPVDEAVLDVMRDHARLLEVLESLKVDLNTTEAHPEVALEAPGQASCRAALGQEYVIYLLLEPGESAPEGTVRLALPAGDYQARWLNPATGASLGEQPLEAGAGPTTLASPAFTEDIVLRITAAGLL